MQEKEMIEILSTLPPEGLWQDLIAGEEETFLTEKLLEIIYNRLKGDLEDYSYYLTSNMEFNDVLFDDSILEDYCNFYGYSQQVQSKGFMGALNLFDKDPFYNISDFVLYEEDSLDLNLEYYCELLGLPKSFTENPNFNSILEDLITLTDSYDGGGWGYIIASERIGNYIEKTGHNVELKVLNDNFYSFSTVENGVLYATAFLSYDAYDIVDERYLNPHLALDMLLLKKEVMEWEANNEY